MDDDKNKMYDRYHGYHCHEAGQLEHHASIQAEFVCHFPFAVFSVAAAMAFLSLLSFLDVKQGEQLAYRLFHNFHYLHIVFAATGTTLMFMKYSKKVGYGILVGIFLPAIFCTLSDAFLPYLGGSLVGLDMHFHWCFLSHLHIVIPFLLVGVINGLAMSSHHMSSQLFYSISFHVAHIFVSSMAAMLYLISFGFYNWWQMMGFVFVFLIIAVLGPCTLSDIIIPIWFARTKINKTKNSKQW